MHYMHIQNVGSPVLNTIIFSRSHERNPSSYRNFNLALTFFITEFPIDEKDISLSNVNPKYVIFDFDSMATLPQDICKLSVLASRILEAIRMLSVLPKCMESLFSSNHPRTEFS